MQIQAFFTNWHYHKQYHPLLSFYAQRNCRDNQKDNKVWKAKRKSFVYNKKKCWSSKYARKKREDLKNKFKERFFWEFDKQTSQYIAEYKKVDYERDNNTKSIDDTAEALMIDIRFSSFFLLNQDNVNTDTFITSFEIIYLIKTITTNLTYYFFEHAITRNNPNFNCHKSDFFTYITSKRYILDKFYKIIIDTGASK